MDRRAAMDEQERYELIKRNLDFFSAVWHGMFAPRYRGHRWASPPALERVRILAWEDSDMERSIYDETGVLNLFVGVYSFDIDLTEGPLRKDDLKPLLKTVLFLAEQEMERSR